MGSQNHLLEWKLILQPPKYIMILFVLHLYSSFFPGGKRGLFSEIAICHKTNITLEKILPENK